MATLPTMSEQGERAVLWAVALSCVLVPLNSTMIAVALPGIGEELDAGLGSTVWLVTAYLIAMAVLQPVTGRLGDRLGRRTLTLGGLAWFALASAGAAWAPSLEALIAFRIQQAVAGALVVPNATALLRETVAPGRLGARMGLVGAAMPLGAAAGPPLGTVLLAAGGRPALFAINLPLAALAWALVRRATTPAPSGSGLAPARVRAAASFVRAPGFATAAGAVALSNLAMYVTLLAVPLLLARPGGIPERAAGGLLFAMSAAAVVLTPVGGRLADAAGRRAPAAGGLALLAVAIAVLAIRPDVAGVTVLAICLLVAGAGIGLSSTALQVSALEAAGPAAAGAAAGAFSTSRYAGSIAGTALLAGPLAPAAAGFGTLFAALAACAVGSALLALRLPQ